MDDRLIAAVTGLAGGNGLASLTVEDRELTQERLAYAAELNVTHVAKIERSEREPGIRTVSRLAIALRISVAELFDGIDGR